MDIIGMSTVKYKYKIRERWEGHERSAENLRKS